MAKDKGEEKKKLVMKEETYNLTMTMAIRQKTDKMLREDAEQLRMQNLLAWKP